MRPRIAQELDLLRRHYDGVEHVEQAGEDWFHIPRYPVPHGWRIGSEEVSDLPVVFPVKGDYPAGAPYGFLMPRGINFRGTAPGNTGNPPRQVPFAGEWLHFSWTVNNWAAGSDLHKGSNLLAWSRSFAVRLRDGA